MKHLEVKSSPFVHASETTWNLHIDMLIGLLAVMVIGVVQNGLRVLVLCLLSAFSAWLIETIGLLIQRRFMGSDLRSLAMGVTIALLCPVTVPLWLPVSASIFSVLFVRVLLPRQYQTLFMTPVLAWLYMLSVSPASMTTFPAVRFFGAFPLWESVEASPLQILLPCNYKQIKCLPIRLWKFLPEVIREAWVPPVFL